MCDPITLTVAAVSVASTAATIVSEVRAAKRQEAAVHEQLAQTEREIDTKATAEINERRRVARREQARIKVAAGEAGLQLQGSIDALLMDSLMQSNLAEDRTQTNREFEQTAARAEANSMLSRIERPTVLGAGLRLAGAAMDGYASGTSLKINRQNAQRAAAGG